MKKQGIVISTLQVSAALLFIKVLGVFKQSLIASICGATAETDAYFVATGITVALCSVLFSSVSISLLSIHNERLISKGRESSNNLINAVLKVFIPISIGIALLFSLCSTGIAKGLAPSYSKESQVILSNYIRVMSVMFVFSCYYLIVNVVLETDKRFLPGKGQSFFQNLFICIAVLVFYPRFGMPALLYAFILAGVVQCVQITWSARHDFYFVSKVKSESIAVRKILQLSLPLLVGNAMYEINDIVDKRIATGLGYGNVSFLSYGASINEIVTTLIIQSVSTVLFSHYATWVAEGENDKIEDNLKKSIGFLVVLILPVMVMCFVCGDCIVDILYGRGSFNESAKNMTTSVVLGYAAGFLFQATRAIFVRVYYAFQNTKTPMINGAISIAINVILSILFSKVIGVGGIALATSIAMFLVTAMLIPGIKKYLPGFSLRSSLTEFIKASGISIVIGIAAYIFRSQLRFGALLSFVVIGCFTVFSYVGAAYLMKIRTITEGIKIIFARLKKH